MKPSVGILAYGSLIANPDWEIESVTADTKVGIKTPFNVEFARSSQGRRGAPTLIPVTDQGVPVRAWLFVLAVSEAEAKDRLYRREIDRVGSGRSYTVSQTPGLNTVVVRRLENFEEVDVVLYTEIAANIHPLNAKELARRAIESAKGSDDGRDGISYLIDVKKHGIRTALLESYEEMIKTQMEAANLHEALLKARCS